jgi:hypothetical protein
MINNEHSTGGTVHFPRGLSSSRIIGSGQTLLCWRSRMVSQLLNPVPDGLSDAKVVEEPLIRMTPTMADGPAVSFVVVNCAPPGRVLLGFFSSRTGGIGRRGGCPGRIRDPVKTGGRGIILIFTCPGRVMGGIVISRLGASLQELTSVGSRPALRIGCPILRPRILT